MGECSVLGCDGDDGLGYDCNECGQRLCAEHRLPENHRCPGLLRTGEFEGKHLSTGLANKDVDGTERGRVSTQNALEPETLGTARDPELLDPTPEVETGASHERPAVGGRERGEEHLGIRFRWATWLYRVGGLAVLLVVVYVVLKLIGVA